MRTSQLCLNVAPITFEGTLVVGSTPWEGDERYRELREAHRSSHVFRYDSSNEKIFNVALKDGVLPLGEVREADPADHLFLLGKVLQRLTLDFLDGRLPVLHPANPVRFWGGKRDSRLLTKAVSEINEAAVEGLDVLVKYTVGTRVVSSGSESRAMLCLLTDVGTSNQIDVPVHELAAAGFDVRGRSVCVRREEDGDPAEGLLARLDWVGEAQALRDGVLTLSGSEISSLSAREALLEPRRENFDDVVRHYYGARADRLLGRVSELRANYVSAGGKLQRIKQTMETLRSDAGLRVNDGLSFVIGDLLESGSAIFPAHISTDRPALFFGAQGRDQSPIPDQGVGRWGPFRFSFHEKNDVVIGVICEAGHRGRVEQFMEALRTGVPDHEWTGRSPNPYSGGLIGKFRLSSVNFRYEEVRVPTSDGYSAAIDRLLNSETPDLAYVQTRESFHQSYGDANPYLVSKARFMLAGVPVQGVEIETIEGHSGSVAYVLNNIALATYAKLGGTPWVMAVRKPTTHEIVLGLGYTETGHRTPEGRRRFVAITTLFSGDGRYLLMGRTREVEFEDYPDALLENLRSTVQHVREQNQWQPGDSVRLVFHVYKHLKHREIEAVKALVGELAGDELDVQYAFLDLSRWHLFNLFEPGQKGRSYGRGGTNKGKGVPPRGTCLRLDDRAALLHLVGPGDLKTSEQGLPQPLLLSLHPLSDFDDLPYLARQVYHFSYMSWRSFFPSTEPVTILYSRLAARKLASLREVSGWSSTPVLTGALRESKWFL